MKLLTLSIMMSCNRRCRYCPIRRWLKPASSWGGNQITNALLLKWLDAYINPDEWIIEITGGEPGLYDEIQTLIPQLDERGYRGLVKTNGSLPIPKSGGLQLIAAWHAGEEFPQYYDQIAIIKNPDDRWEVKEEHCRANGIPYQLVEFEAKGAPVDAGLRTLNRMTACLHINSTGQITGCSKDRPDEEKNIFNMTEPVLRDDIIYRCPKCKNINDVERFLRPDLREWLERDYGDFIHTNAQ